MAYIVAYRASACKMAEVDPSDMDEKVLRGMGRYSLLKDMSSFISQK